MKLSQAQRMFTDDIRQLVTYCYDILGYELTYGDAYRSPKAHGAQGEQGPYGEAWSAHKNRLAVDFNLFVDGVWIEDGNHPAWKDLGDYWVELDEDNVWGGEFNDANHFSRRWAGIA